jgi:hypothetical protein
MLTKKTIPVGLHIPTEINEAMKKVADRNKRSAKAQYLWEIEHLPEIQKELKIAIHAESAEPNGAQH